ncbi:MAG: ferric reductase NAD binding domain-containing protein [Piptocephalis tieghemiana]|nr:MAG: ferric reductase NAD binding domain-containing protein [Piptocephalis tieghemiana]
MAREDQEAELSSVPSLRTRLGLHTAKRDQLQELKTRFNSWMVNDGKTFIFLCVWILSQIFIFLVGAANYTLSDNYQGARILLGTPLVFARASAFNLHICMALLFLPICRTLISFLRTTPLNSIIPFDSSVSFHKVIAYTILFFTAIHCGAHIVNYHSIALYNGDGGKGAISLWFLSGPGWTGNLMLLSLLLIAITSIKRVRSHNYEVFWYTHHLYVVFIGLFSFHGAFCMIQPDRQPKCGNAGSFWKYWVFSGALYLLERIAREWRARTKTYVTKVILHPSHVVEVQMRKEDLDLKAGQHVFLCCPEVSLIQWHPFTLTSAPEEDFISVHIRLVGDWTMDLAYALGVDFDDGKHMSRHRRSMVGARGREINRLLPRVYVDGPFGSATEDVFKYEVAVLFGAGIGVTPFASILKSIWYRAKYPHLATRLRKVYFYWICRDYQAVEWFHDLLKAIEAEDIDQFIEIHVYLTGSLSPDAIRNVVMNDREGETDALTGLRSPTNYGRPQLNRIFSGLSRRHVDTDVGVFFCGPPALGRRLHTYCNLHSDGDETGTKFFYNKDSFTTG